VQQAISKYWEYKKDVNEPFIEFSKAFVYDRLNRKKVCQKQEKFGTSKKLIKLREMALNGPLCKVKIDGELPETFEVKTGVRQGDGLSGWTDIIQRSIRRCVTKSETDRHRDGIRC
jgi:hypothetical protein